MKKFFISILIGVVAFCTSCSNQQSSMSDRTKKNLENAGALAKMFESHDWSKVGDYIAADAVDHAGPRGTEVKGLDSIKAEFQEFGNSMTDMKNEVVKELADDDYVFSMDEGKLDDDER